MNIGRCITDYTSHLYCYFVCKSFEWFFIRMKNHLRMIYKWNHSNEKSFECFPFIIIRNHSFYEWFPYRDHSNVSQKHDFFIFIRSTNENRMKTFAFVRPVIFLHEFSHFVLSALFSFFCLLFILQQISTILVQKNSSFFD